MSRKSKDSLLKKKRIEAGLTQKQLSLYLGFTTCQHVSNNERGMSYYSPSLFNKIAKLYGISREEIIKDYTLFKLKKLNEKIAKIKNK